MGTIMTQPRKFVRRWLLPCAVALGASAIPLTLGPAGEIRQSAACADGTCCPEPGSDCIIDNKLTENAYARLSGGACTEFPEQRPKPGT